MGSPEIQSRLIVDRNPADHAEVVAEVAAARVDDVDRSFEQAAAAAAAWAVTSPVHRSRVLLAIGAEIETQVDAHARDLVREEGKTFGEAQAEVRRAVHVFRYYAGLALTGGGHLHPSERPSFRIENRREPLGVVTLITPWNFPYAIPAWKAAPALAAGNAVVLKPAPQTPLSADNLQAAAYAGGLPDGLLQVLHGGPEVGLLAGMHQLVAAISFTGSTAGGRTLYRSAAENWTPMQGELGGHNPLVVLADALLDDAVAIAVDGAFSSTGQKCTATRRILVQESIYEEFLSGLLIATRSLRIGSPFDDSSQIGPVISAEQLALNEVGVARACEQGAKVAVGGHVLTSGDLAKGWYFAPTVLTGVGPGDDIAQQEVFGPIVSVIPFHDLDEAVSIANGTAYGLSAAICTTNLVSAEDFVRRSHSGVVAVNAATAGIEIQAPLFGVKASGVGPAEQGREAMEFFSRPKAVYTRTPGLG